MRLFTVICAGDCPLVVVRPHNPEIAIALRDAADLAAEFTHDASIIDLAVDLVFAHCGPMTILGLLVEGGFAVNEVGDLLPVEPGDLLISGAKISEIDRRSRAN